MFIHTKSTFPKLIFQFFFLILGYHIHISNMRVRLQEGKGKVLPSTGQEGQEGEYRYSSTLSLTSALDGDGWSTPRPGCLTPRERRGTHCIGGWVWNGRCGRGAEILAFTGIRFPDRSARSESLYRLSYPGQSSSARRLHLFTLWLVCNGDVTPQNSSK
jgi:hypothetical protein